MLSWEDKPALMAMRCSRAWVEIDLHAIRHNVQQFKQLLQPTTDLMAVVKADAYGHGATAVAQVAIEAGATWLGVATVPEGIELRQAGLEVPILVMGALRHPEEVEALVRWRLQPTIVDLDQAILFSKAIDSDGPPLPIQLKLDTGMSRLGCSWQRAAEFVDGVSQLPNLKVVSLYSHFATADEADPTVMEMQHQRFQTAIAALRTRDLLPPHIHLANTAATMAAAAALQYDMVRIGLGIYGLSPAPHLTPALSLRPALTLKARITQVKPIAAGTGVSYGHRYVAPRNMTIAVVGIGYADGVPRQLSNRLQVSIHDQRVPQIGNITMDQLMLDVSALETVMPGDIVTLISPDAGLTADAWASHLSTISWEILCGFKHRLPRILLGNRQEIPLPG